MASVVSVVAASGPAAPARHLAAGQRLVFGVCHCGRCRFDLVVPAPTGSAAVGRIWAYRDHWRLDNLGTTALGVTDLDDSRQLITVHSGRTGPVPFESAQIIDGEQRLATVSGPGMQRVAQARASCPVAGQPAPVAELNRRATYFAVLLTLCEPWLRPNHAPAVTGVLPALPTSREIAATLTREGMAITPRAVDAHIQYLVDKLDLRPSGPMARSRRGWRKEALAAAALRRQLVRPAHLPARPSVMSAERVRYDSRRTAGGGQISADRPHGHGRPLVAQ